jgi:hypothetical protein
MPIIRGEESEVRSALVIEEDQPYGLPHLPGPVRIRSLVSRYVRLTEIPAHGVCELYDWIADPGEMVNVASSDSDLLAKARELLLSESVALQDGSRVPFHAA